MSLAKITSTIGLNIAKLDKPNGEFIFWDVGGQTVLRKIWDKYFAEANGLIFVIDGAEEIRFNEVKETLQQVFERGETEGDTEIMKADASSSHFDSLPVLFLVNKNDS